MSRYRHDQGKTSYSQHTNTHGLGHTSHFREGPQKGFNPHQPPVVVVIPPSKPDSPIIEVPDNPTEPPHQVPDSGAFTAIAFVLFAVAVAVRRINQ